MRIKKISQTTSTNATIIDGYSESTQDGYSCNYVNNGLGKILWTNPNPTSSFAEQNITLSSSDYDMYEVVFHGSQTGANTFNTGKIPKGMNAFLQQTYSTSGAINVRSRTINYVNDTTFLVIGGLINGSTDNTQCIPVYVIGYKTNLFN